jgi:16S rRNA (cytosine967-C5)-methyltransferase
MAKAVREKGRKAREVALGGALTALKGGRVKEAVRRARASSRDRALAERIAVGSIKRHLTLTNVLNAFSRKKHSNPEFAEVIRQAVYQIWFMNTRPAVAVNTAVALAKRVDRNAGATANALLRRISGLEIERREGRPAPDDWRRSVFLSSDEGGLGHLYLPQRIVRKDPKADLESASSLPAFLAWRYWKRFGEIDFWNLADWANSVPPLSVRLNTLKLGREPAEWNLDTVFSGAGSCEPVEMENLPAGMFRLKDAVTSQMPGFALGLFLAQDPANALPVEAMRLEPGMKVLDMCAAPGTKSLQIAEKMDNRGEVVAVDLDASRLRMVKENSARAGASCISAVNADARELDASWAGGFDRVLLDAPCSNTGAMSRKPEVRLRVLPRSLQELADKQKSLLAEGLRLLRTGGLLVYSTCSLEPEENEQVVDSVRDSVEIVEQRFTMPFVHMRDGGFYALMIK